MTETRAQGFTVTAKGFEFEPDASPAGMEHEGVILNLNVEISGAIYMDYEGPYMCDRYAHIDSIDALWVEEIENGDESIEDAQGIWADFLLQNNTLHDALLSELAWDDDVQCLILNGD